MSETPLPPTIEDFLKRAQERLAAQPKSASSGEVAQAIISTLWLQEAMRKMTFLMVNARISSNEAPEMIKIREDLDKCLRVGFRGISDMLDQILEDRDGGR